MRDLSFCRSEFPSIRREVNGYPVAYLDGPGGTQVPGRVIDAIAAYYTTSNANVHGMFAASRETDALIEEARVAMAAMLGSPDKSRISFGANMTTLNFALARAIGRSLKAGDEVIVTDLDHDANVAPWLRMAADYNLVVRHVPIRPDATLDMEVFKSLINEKTKLVACGYASNAVGTVNDVYTVRQWTREVGALLVVDAVHFAPHAVVDVAKLDPDFLLCSAYKFFGPHVGILYSRPGALDSLTTDKVRPQLETAPEKIETGTLNHAALAGVKAAVEFIASLADPAAVEAAVAGVGARSDAALDGAGATGAGTGVAAIGSTNQLRSQIVSAMTDMYEYEHGLAKRLYEGLEKIPGVTIHGTRVGEALRAPTVSFTMKGLAPIDVADALGQRGLYVWDGDFYAITVIDRLGLTESGGVVRVGFAPYNTVDEVDRVIKAVRELAG